MALHIVRVRPRLPRKRRPTGRFTHGWTLLYNLAQRGSVTNNWCFQNFMPRWSAVMWRLRRDGWDIFAKKVSLSSQGAPVWRITLSDAHRSYFAGVSEAVA